MTKNEKREHGDVLYEAILTLKDLEVQEVLFRPVHRGGAEGYGTAL